MRRRLGLLVALAACGSEAGQTPPCELLSCPEVQALRLPDSLPVARGNRFGDDYDAAWLGFAVFFDGRLGSGTSCATCHQPELAFTDHLSVAEARGIGTRNTPTVLNSGRMTVFMWDGRADSLWSQPLMAIESPVEMGSSRAALAHLMANDATLREQYEAIFGALPDLSAVPATGKPGDAAYDALSAELRDTVNRIVANVGKALEAYMRKNTTGTAAIERYLDGDASALNGAAVRGLSVFVQRGCIGCHSGPMLSDEKFHDVGMPSLPNAAPDLGRAHGREVVLASEFNLHGPYADDVGTPQEDDVGEPGAFRTPPLRLVSRSAPYGHDGALSSLDALFDAHAPDVPSDERGDLWAFLQTLSGEDPPRPWSAWPASQ